VGRFDGDAGPGVCRSAMNHPDCNTYLKFLLLIAGVLLMVVSGCKKSGTSYYPVPPPVVYDMDSNAYHTVTIGSQAWLVENLRTTRYRNGDPVSLVTDSAAWAAAAAGAYCNYWNLQANVCDYGRLYNGHAVSDPRNIAPAGWHIPSDEEWTTLTTFLGGEPVSGGQLKETGFDHWAVPNSGASNSTRFSGLPAGYRNEAGWFGNQHFSAIYWSSTLHDASHMWYRYMYYNYEGMYRDFYHDTQHGFSVRCVYDIAVGDPGK
jgi:uncharacterized protein (TIGR02145 family)